MTFSESLKTARQRHKLSQAELAKVLEVGKRTIEHWESGSRTPLPVTQEGVLDRLHRHQSSVPADRSGSGGSSAPSSS
jgi:transcriptional regulator with XRE-family HTH domain